MIVLDTHIFLWLNLAPKKIPAKIVTALDKEPLWGIPAISLWEIAMLDSKGRIALPKPALSWLRDVLSPVCFGRQAPDKFFGRLLDFRNS